MFEKPTEHFKGFNVVIKVWVILLELSLISWPLSVSFQDFEFVLSSLVTHFIYLSIQSFSLLLEVFFWFLPSTETERQFKRKANVDLVSTKALSPWYLI